MHYLTHGWKWSGEVVTDAHGFLYVGMMPRRPRMLPVLPGEWPESTQIWRDRA